MRWVKKGVLRVGGIFPYLALTYDGIEVWSEPLRLDTDKLE